MYWLQYQNNPALFTDLVFSNGFAQGLKVTSSIFDLFVLFYLKKSVNIVRFGNLLLFYINFYIYCLEEKGTVYLRRMDQGGASSTVKGNFWTIYLAQKKN